MTVLDVQCGVLTFAQARGIMTRGQIRAHVDARRWQRPHRGVLVTHNGPLTRDQELWVCLLAAPPGSALAGPTAAELDGLRGFESDRIWLVVPKGQRRLTRDGVVVTSSAHLGPADVHAQRAPRRTTIERSLLDMCGNAGSLRAARAPLLAAVQQRAFDTLRRHRGLPPPTRQRVIRRPDGRYYLDADWAAYDLSAEIHGLPHLEVRNWDADLDRHNELSIDGRRLLQFCSYAVRHQPRRVGEQLERGLRRAGWRSGDIVAA